MFILAILAGSLASRAQFSSAHLTAAGLTCAMCTKAIYKSLEKMPGVSRVEADIKNSGFNIEFKEGASVDPDALKAAVEGAGFSVAGLRLKGNFDNISIANDAHVQIGDKTFHFLDVKPQNLKGQKVVTIVDRNFVTARKFRQYAASTNHPCVETGKAESCCAKAGTTLNNRIYHVTI